MKQVTIDELVTELSSLRDKYGPDEPVYYHICGHPDSYNCPMEVEGVEIRVGFCGEDKVTIW